MSLINLPLELLWEVCSLLTPREVVAARQTCKTIYRACQENGVVWTAILDQVCLDNGIFRPSFPLQHMSVSELEQATLSPSRFLTYLKRGLTEGNILQQTEQTLSVMTLGSAVGSSFRAMALVPGGRYLFTLSDSLLVQLWDLGLASTPAPHITAIASLPITHAVNNVRWIQMTGDGKGIRLLIHHPTGDPNSFEFRIYEIYPMQNQSAFNLCASIILNTSFYRTGFWFAGDLILIHQGSYLTVWDFVHDKWARFDTGMWASQLDLCNDILVLFNDSAISLWKIPPLHARKPHSEPPNQANSPLMQFHHRGSDVDSTVAAQSCHWRPYTATKQRPYFLDVFSGNSLPAAITHYVFKVVEDGSTSDCVPVAVAETPTPDTFLTTLTSPKSTRMSEDFQDAVFFWADGDELKVVISTVPNEFRAEIPKHVSGAIVKYDEEVDYEVCPYSGRICLLGADGGTRIRILTYLSPLL